LVSSAYSFLVSRAYSVGFLPLINCACSMATNNKFSFPITERYSLVGDDMYCQVQSWTVSTRFFVV
jgi:hypothetical protein